GAGKTSLVNVMTGVYQATSGTVRIDGHDVELVGRSGLAGLGVSRTFQNLALFDGLSALENVLVGAHVRLSGGIMSSGLRLPKLRKSEKRARAVALEAMELVGIADIADKEVSELSFGTQKRLEIARALALQP